MSASDRRVVALEGELATLREELARVTELLLTVMDNARASPNAMATTIAHVPEVIRTRERLEEVSAQAVAHRARLCLQYDAKRGG